MGREWERDDPRPDANQAAQPDGFKKFILANNRVITIAATALALGLFLLVVPRQALNAIILGLFARRLYVGFLLVFAVVTLSLFWSIGERFDARLFLYFNRRALHSPRLDAAMWGITQLGSGLFSMIGGVLLYIIDERRLAVEVILGTLTLWLIVELIKALLNRSRPFRSISETRVIGRKAIGRSYPSGHSAQAFFLATLLAVYFEPGMAISLVVFFLAGLVALTRIFIGAHYPRDVVAGAMLGTVWGFLGALVDAYLVGQLG